jgi:hypothetical protein
MNAVWNVNELKGLSILYMQEIRLSGAPMQ